MKTAEGIREAMKKDLEAGEVNAILTAAEAEKHTGIPKKSRKVLVLAAAVCLLTVSVSAAAVLSGFGTAFTVPLETGGVEVLDVRSTNEDVSWEITEVWFDEYNLYLGGNVTTPEPLDMEGEYTIFTYFKEPCESEDSIMFAEIFPNGTNTSAFVMQTYHHKGEDGTWERQGVEKDTITLELSFRYFQDIRDVSPNTNVKDYVILPGEWTYTVNLTRQSDNGIYLTDVYTSEGNGSRAITVDSVQINPFTLEITGENLLRQYDKLVYPGGSVAVTDENGKVYMHSDPNDPPVYEKAKAEYIIWLKMKDGTLLGKDKSFAHTENRFEHSEVDDTRILCCFDNPVDLTQIQSILFVSDWATFPDSAEDFLIRDGWEYYEDPTDPTRLEGWKTVMEIPAG